MSDIVEMLREFATDYTTTTYHDELIREAADEIERLREGERAADAEIERLRELLGETYGYIHIPYGASHEDVAEISDVRQRVREALGDE